MADSLLVHRYWPAFGLTMARGRPVGYGGIGAFVASYSLALAGQQKRRGAKGRGG